MGSNPLFFAGRFISFDWANLMKAKLSGFACAVAVLLFIGTSSAKAEFVTVPISGFLFPGESINAFFPEVPDTIHQKVLTFEGNIQNTTRSTTVVSFWFDWFDGSSIVTTTPQFFPLGPEPFGFQFFSRTDGTELTYTIPYCPPEVSIHFGNEGPGGPVSVSGLFTYECRVPEPVALLILPVMVLMAPWALRRVKALASSV